ncbi:hypothetical protein BO79DRAFT_226781 [Aspergillus costaricaensis CBS 115574]|uniref:Uncharacterized protein n=1 Tax=Aspergillus costaricaensis CBS 115574 TaxID=1448317 RepID=A0ACD1IJJ9_9EURO|nr:hypothetical protein BO79DRAFT_226781 [Aspergillus costaricaensis CBS 115574]RAK90419.1 hypothetical protein BO79DRAFT_226781 [Aspergillus costaricaensis CBS 115574]
MALSSHLAKKHEFHPAGAGDLRSPCPVLNALANHGIISCDGRNITANQLKDALKYIGVGIDIRLGLVNSAYAVHDEHSHCGLRNLEQVDDSGIPKRYIEQNVKNEILDFGYRAHIVACAEAALFQGVFGEGVFRQLLVKYAKAVFQEERLPFNEGWTPRWFALIVPELAMLVLIILYFAS